MDSTQIPKSFWHSVSFCMVIVTIGILIIAYKSSSVSIEIANAKIDLSSALSTTKNIKSGLQDENERLKKANAEMKEALVKVFQNPNVNVETLVKSWLLVNPDEETDYFNIDSKVFDNLDEKFERIENIVMAK